MKELVTERFKRLCWSGTQFSRRPRAGRGGTSSQIPNLPLGWQIERELKRERAGENKKWITSTQPISIAGSSARSKRHRKKKRDTFAQGRHHNWSTRGAFRGAKKHVRQKAGNERGRAISTIRRISRRRRYENG